MEKDFNLEMRVRNGRLLRRIREKYESTAAMCREVGLNQTTVSQYLAMKIAPRNKHGDDWRNTALAICGALGCDPVDIWPEHMQRASLKKSKAEADLSLEEAAGLLTAPQESVSHKLLLEELCEGLPPRTEYVMRAHASGSTYDEIGGELGITRERVRQIEAKGIRIARGRVKRRGYRSVEDGVLGT